MGLLQVRLALVPCIRHGEEEPLDLITCALRTEAPLHKKKQVEFQRRTMIVGGSARLARSGGERETEGN